MYILMYINRDEDSHTSKHVDQSHLIFKCLKYIIKINTLQQELLSSWIYINIFIYILMYIHVCINAHIYVVCLYVCACL